MKKKYAVLYFLDVTDREVSKRRILSEAATRKRAAASGAYVES